MKNNVNLVPLEDVAELNPRFNKTTESSELVSFVPMAAVSEVTGQIVKEELRPYSEVARGFTPFQSDDVIIAKITPCFQNGKIAHANLSRQYGFGSTEFHVVRSDKQKLLPRYVFHFLRQDHIRASGERRMTGSAGQRRVPENYLAELRIPLPPLFEQKRIAEILDRAEALRAKRRTTLALLDELTQSIFLDMFGDPVTNPKGWNNSKVLADVASIGSGITKGRKVKDATREVPYLAVLNVQDKRLDLTVIKTIEATDDEVRRYRLLPDDLLLTEGGDADKLGRGTLWNGELAECIHQNHIFRVRLTSDDLTPLFLNWLVGSQYGKNYFLQSAKQTTGIATINKSQLGRFPLLLPPKNIQLAFANRINRLEAQKVKATKALSQIDDLFVSLQHKAFRGEL